MPAPTEFSITPEMHRYTKLKNALYWRLHGLGYHVAIQAFHFSEAKMAGKTRKDGITPAFQHQIQIALQAFTLKGVIDLERLIAVILLHDDMEDFDTDVAYFKLTFGQSIYDGVWPMTKTYLGFVKDPQQVFWEIGNDPASSLAKLLDRINNFGSMVGVFSTEKQIAYIREGEELFLPMSKRARKKFPQQIDAYLNVETFLRSQISLLKVINNIN